MKQPPTESTCFVISPIGSEESKIRKRSDNILNNIIRPAAEKVNLTAVRADEIDKQGMITDQILQYVIESPIVVADLTGDNANVYYELAVRHAWKMPFVLIIQEGDRAGFDIQGMRTIRVNYPSWDTIPKNVEQLVEHMRNALDDPDSIRTPITHAVNMIDLHKGGTDMDDRLLDIHLELSALRNDVVVSRIAFEKTIHNMREREFVRQWRNAIVHDIGRSDPLMPGDFTPSQWKELRESVERRRRKASDGDSGVLGTPSPESSEEHNLETDQEDQ